MLRIFELFVTTKFKDRGLVDVRNTGDYKNK